MNYQSRAPAGVRGIIRKSASGFTLIEIMVAITLFAIVISILLSSFSFLISRVSFVGEGVPVYEQARICFDRLTTDLQSLHVALPPAYTPPDFDADPDPYRVVAASRFDKERQFRFVAFSHLPLGGGLPLKEATIVYYLDETEEKELVLRRRDTVSLMADDAGDRFQDSETDGNDPVLFEHVRSLDFVFFDAQGNRYDHWDSESDTFDYATPRAVQVIVVASSGEINHRFETMIDLPVFREAWERGL